MKAVVIAGGSGTRLRPLTCNIPKPMVPIANKPIMEHIIHLLKKHNISDIAVTLQYMPGIIKDYFGDGNEFNVRIKYYTEQTPLGTAGSVKNAEKFFDDTFIVISGDALTDINLKDAINFHFSKNSMATLILKKVDAPTEYGVVVTDDDGKIQKFFEKPSWGEIFSDTVNTGIYILSNRVLNYFKKDQVFDFSKDLFPLLLKNNQPIFGYVTDSYWCDIGDLKAYVQAHIDILDGKVNISMPGKQVEDNIWVGEGAVLHPSTIINGPCIIGKGSILKENVIIDKYSVIGDNSIVCERSSLKRSITWKNCYIENNVQLRGCVICDNAHIKSHAHIFEHSVIGMDTIVFDEAIVKPDVKIWPNKKVDYGSVVSNNIVWGSRHSSSIFGNRGISGIFNKELSAEYASKLAIAYNSILDKTSKIGLSCDHHPASNAIKLAFESGLLSSGADVLDFGELLIPIARSAARFYNTHNSVHISSKINKNNLEIHIDFLNKNGANIDKAFERKIENILFSEELKKVEGFEVRNAKIINGYIDFYIMSILNSMHSTSLGYKIALNECCIDTNKILIDILNLLGCKISILKFSKTDEDYNEKSLFLDKFKEKMPLENFDIGIYIQDDCEKMVLIDNTGEIISEDTFMALVCIILLKSSKAVAIVAPISASDILESLASENNGKIIRTKTSEQDIMNTILDSGKEGSSIEQFSMHFDAIIGLSKILDFMKANQLKLTDLINMIPKSHIHRTHVKCEWNAKGKVIREIMQESKNQKTETIEGIKIYNNDSWILILPDSQRPQCNIISEGLSLEAAKELTDIYVNKIIEINKMS